MPLPADVNRVDSGAAFSPDGKSLAFVANRTDSLAALGRDEVWIVGTAAGAVPRLLLTVWSPNHQHLEWSPDGRQLALLVGDEARFNSYITDRIAVADVATGSMQMFAADLDRAVRTRSTHPMAARSPSRWRTTACSTPHR